MVGFIEPLAERVVPCAGGRGGECGGEGGVRSGGGEKGASRAVGIGQRGERRGGGGEDGGESMDAITGFGDGFPPGVDRIGIGGRDVRVLVRGGRRGGGEVVGLVEFHCYCLGRWVPNRLHLLGNEREREK